MEKESPLPSSPEGEGSVVAGTVTPFGRICNPPAWGMEICNPLGVESHYKCANSILPDCKSGRTGGMGAESGLILLKIHDIIFIISRGK